MRIDVLGMSKGAGVQELYRRLRAAPPSSSMGEAYSLMEDLLDKVETDRRGKTYEEDVVQAYQGRMMLDPYPGSWYDIGERVAYSNIMGRRTIWLFNDGAIRVTRGIKNGPLITEFWKYGAGLLRGTTPAGKLG